MEKVKVKDNIIKRWYKLTNPHKGYFLGQILFYAGYTIFLTIITIFAAKTINYMYSKNWSMAFLFLMLELATIILRNVSMHIQYYFYGKQIIHIRTNVANKVYKKIISCKNSELKTITKEKVTNIALNNMSNLSEFPDSIASFIAYSIQVVVTLVTVFVSNWIAGVIVALLGVVNFFAYYNYNKRLGTLMNERYEKKDELYKSYCKVIDGKNLIHELNANKVYRREVVDGVKAFSESYAHYYNVYSWKNNMYWATWNVVVYAIAALMMFFVSKGSLDIAIYLIIVPYLSTCTDKLCTLFDKTSNLENMRVDVDRVNLILGLSDRELEKYGNINKQNEGYNLGFVNVTCNATSKETSFIKNADMSFNMGTINLVKGEKGSGKRSIFDLLRRYRKPNDGLIMLDNLNLYYYNEKTFKSHINYCSSHPEFIKGTIRENLRLVKKNMTKIKSYCNELGLMKYIQKLPKGFDTDISDIKDSAMLFMLGLARAALSDCNILMIYELPQDVSEKFKKNIKKLLTQQEIRKTVILFSHSDDYDDIAETIYEVDNGVVKLIK